MSQLPRALMVDVDGEIITLRAGSWAADLGRDLGLSGVDLQEHFFRPYWNDIAPGRAAPDHPPACRLLVRARRPAQRAASFAPDDRALYFHRLAGGRFAIWRLSR